MAKKNKTTVTISGGGDSVTVDMDKLRNMQTEQLRLTYAALVNNTCTYSHSVRLENGESDTITNQCAREFHIDLREVFRLLDGHLAVATEQVDVHEVKDIESCEGMVQSYTDKLLQVEVSDVKIIGNLETGCVILTGQKLLKSEEEIKLKSPKIALDGEYEFVQELVGAISNLINEVSMYHSGKSRPDPQGNLFEPIDAEEENI
jgi:hypothetical protein